MATGTHVVLELLDARDVLPPGRARDRLDTLTDELIRRALLTGPGRQPDVTATARGH